MPLLWYTRAMTMGEITERLSRQAAGLTFGPPVAYVYNPLEYAQAGWDAYVTAFGNGPREVLLVGMNPGPFGMAQTGVPFGDVPSVRDWMGLRADIGKPREEHLRRPVEGFACQRREVSGQRLWGWAAKRFGTALRFFERFFVTNYCPLCFLEASGRNRTPDKLPALERTRLFKICDGALAAQADHFHPKYVIGIGAFAETRIRSALDGRDVRIGRILHPSPASPAANRGWDTAVEAALEEMGVHF